VIGEVVKELVRELDTRIVEQNLGKPILGHGYEQDVPSLSSNHFKEIRKTNSDRKLAFIDGGNQELVGAPNFSIQLNRVYFNLFKKRTIIQPSTLPNRIEFFSATYAEFKNGQIFYETSLFPSQAGHAEYMPEPTDLSSDSMDRRLTVGMSRADIGRVASIARRFTEWSYAKQIVDYELESGDTLVMDGILRTAFEKESKYAKAAYSIAKQKNVIYTGLAKTCRLFTTTGLSLVGAIRRLASDSQIGPAWYYPVAYSVSPEHQANIFLVKLSDQSQRVFRFEIQADQAEELQRTNELDGIFSELALNSNDLSFPGYPYGLVDADDNARVRFEELETYRVMLLSEISKIGSAAKFVRHMEAIDAHVALNSLKEVSYA
jgi:hypothetical protein